MRDSLRSNERGRSGCALCTENEKLEDDISKQGRISDDEKMLRFALLLAFVIILTACGAQNTTGQQQKEDTDSTLLERQSQEIHTIAYPDDYPTAQDEYGADAFEGTLNHPAIM
jgi:hypothetical protein